MALSIQFPFENQLLSNFAEVISSVIRSPFIQSICNIFEEIKEEVVYELDHPEEEKVWT